MTEETKGFWGWLKANASQVQALSAIVSVLAAIGGVWLIMHQIDASDRQQRRQSAREIYREFVKLSIEKPELAEPDYCAIKGSESLKDDTEYENYIEFQLYASEQILAELPEWEETMDKRLAPHAELLCSEESWSGDTDDVRAMIGRFRKSSCAGFKSACADTEDATP